MALVKPQFETEFGSTEGGVVQDESLQLQSVEAVRSALEAQGFRVDG